MLQSRLPAKTPDESPRIGTDFDPGLAITSIFKNTESVTKEVHVAEDQSDSSATLQNGDIDEEARPQERKKRVCLGL